MKIKQSVDIELPFGGGRVCGINGMTVANGGIPYKTIMHGRCSETR
jgi:hypothetical protein